MTAPRWHRTAPGRYYADVERGGRTVRLFVERLEEVPCLGRWRASSSEADRWTTLARTLREAKVAAEGLLETREG